MIDVVLKEDERIDDLERNGYKIIQNSKKFCFGIDAVLLSSFARVNDGENVLDLGTGTGIIPILLKGKTNGEHFTGLEIQDDSADMAMRSVIMNGLESDIDIVKGDIKEADKLFKKASFSVCVFSCVIFVFDHLKLSGIVINRINSLILNTRLSFG